MDESELREQLATLHGRAFGWALSCCGGDRTEAEEVLQTAYLKVLTGKARFGDRSSFKTWLFSVIRLTAADARRKHALAWLGKRKLQQRHREQKEATDDDPTAQIQQARLRDRFRELLAALPERQRQVIHLVFYDDHTVSEAAEIMGVSLGSARTHYHRGKRRLRDWLREQEHDVGAV